MKQALLFIFAFASLSALSQSVWTKGNAVWHYKFTNVAERGYTKLWENGDTTLLGKQCTKIRGARHSFMMSGPNGPLFESTSDFMAAIIYTSNDTVFYWDQDHFSILADFSAQVNDQWLLQRGYSDFDCNDTSICVVESVATVSLNGQNARELTVSPTSDSYVELLGKVNSRFGATGCYLRPFPRSCGQGFIDMDLVSLICFEDDSLYYNPTGEACEYYLGLDELSKSKVTVFPNPTAGKIELLSDIPLKKIRVTNLLGAILKEFDSNLTLTELDLSELPQGTYYLHIENSDNEQSVKPVQVSGK